MSKKSSRQRMERLIQRKTAEARKEKRREVLRKLVQRPGLRTAKCAEMERPVVLKPPILEQLPDHDLVQHLSDLTQ